MPVCHSSRLPPRAMCMIVLLYHATVSALTTGEQHGFSNGCSHHRHAGCRNMYVKVGSDGNRTSLIQVPCDCSEYDSVFK